MKLSNDELIEVGIVGTLLLNPSYYFYAESVSPKMFHYDEYKGLFWAVSELIKDGVEQIDDFTIISKLRENDGVFKIYKDEIESHGFDDIINKIKLLGTNDLNEFRRRVEKLISVDFRKIVPTKLRNMATQIENDNEKHINELNQNIHSELMKVSEKYLVTKELPMLKDMIDDIYSQIQERITDNGVVGLPSKFEIVNSYFTYEDGELITVGAPKKTGKSVFILNEAWHKASQGVPTLILDTELSSRQFGERLLSHITGISVRNIKSGRYDESGKEKISKAIVKIKETPLSHCYLPEVLPDWKFEELFVLIKSYHQKMNLGFICFDYIKQNKVDANIAEHNYLANLTEFLKNGIAGRLKIPVLAMAQMNKEKTRLGESDKISRYSSVVAYLIKKDMEQQLADGNESGEFMLKIENNRLGRQFDEDEYICLSGDLDVMSFKQSKKQPKLEKELPYE